MLNNGFAKILAGAIKKCSEDLGISPQEVEFNDFQKWFSKSKSNLKLSLGDNVARAIKVNGGFRNIRDAFYSPSVKVDGLVFKELSKLARDKAKAKAVKDDFLLKFQEFSTKLFKEFPISVPKSFNPKANHGSIERANHLIVSDTHFGARNYVEEGLDRWSTVEQSRSMAKVALEAADYKSQYRNKSKLYFNAIGDLIQGKLHNPLDGERMAKQKAIALHIMLQAIAYLAPAYPNGIEMNCIGGNHDRDSSLDKDRVSAGKWDNHATVIYYAIKKALELAKINNVKVNIPQTPWISYKVFGVNYFGTHGDNFFKAGNVGSSFNVKALEAEVNKLNASLKDTEEYKVIMLGHIHFKSLLGLNNGVTVITNPALLGPDAFAKSIGIWEGRRGQWIYESTPGYPVGDSRTIDLDKNTDADSSLDKIITEFDGF